MIIFLTNWNEWELFLPFIETQVKTKRMALQEVKRPCRIFSLHLSSEVSVWKVFSISYHHIRESEKTIQVLFLIKQNEVFREML